MDASDDEPPVKCGRVAGAGKWHQEDFTTLLDLAEELLPAGKCEWLGLYNQFAKWVVENSRPVRSAETIEKQVQKGMYSLHIKKSIYLVDVACAHN
jgi:hypothetical protein